MQKLFRCWLVLVSIVVVGAAAPVRAVDDLEDKSEPTSELVDIQASSDTSLEIEVPGESGEPEDTVPASNKSRLLISEFQLSGRDTIPGYFVELYNNSDEYFTESGWRLEYVVANTSASGFGEVRLLANLDFSDLDFDPHGYAVVGAAETDDIAINTVTTNATQGYIRIVDDGGETVDLLGYGSATNAKNAEGGKPITSGKVAGKSAQRCERSPGIIVDTDINVDDFDNYELSTPGFGVSCVGGADYEAEPINQCSGLVLSEIGANLSEQFVEVYNSIGATLDISGCGLKTNRSGQVFVFANLELAAYDYMAFRVADTGLTLTKTTTGTVYLLDSTSTTIDSTYYENLKADTTWSRFDSGWLQTYTATPNEANFYEEFAACAIGYERNLETGRCRKIAVEALLPDCGEGKFRNPETNRCKSLTSLAAEYTPCAEGYYRNPDTNRCKKIASDDGLTPCQDGYERNPETNRCRKVRVNSGADYGVEPSEQNDTASFVGWLAFGILAIAGLGYVGLEFRREIVAAVKKILHITGKK
ncbi:MAG: hypothetical protein LBL84_02195 [Candidatus Nomurabacteria bacterium]|jgi:hypothetical protein|nr:hypothetical protein [Candidatus Nomurabacteria bacterium]